MEIEQIDEHIFERFDNAESDDEKLYTVRSLAIAYSHKIREIINVVNILEKQIRTLSEKCEVNID